MTLAAYILTKQWSNAYLLLGEGTAHGTSLLHAKISRKELSLSEVLLKLGNEVICEKHIQQLSSAGSGQS